MSWIISNVHKITPKQRKKKREKDPIVNQEKIVIIHETNHNRFIRFNYKTFIFSIRDHRFALRLFPTTGCISPGFQTDSLFRQVFW